MPGKKVGARLTDLERRLDILDAKAAQDRGHRPEPTIEELAEIIRILREDVSAVNGIPFTQTLRDIGFDTETVGMIERIYGPTGE